MSQTITDLSELRLDYQRGELREDTVCLDPHQQFLQWFDIALESGLLEPYAMALATTGIDGSPHVRTVLLRGASEQGYDFYSNYDSLKGQDLAVNPRAQLLFYWAELEQQVRISGDVFKISEQESTEYYRKRPHDSQVAAHVSTPQSGVIGSRALLQQRFSEASSRFEGMDQLPKPTFWGGYRLKPCYYEFWQGRPNRLHDRLCYRYSGTEWVLSRLMP